MPSPNEFRKLAEELAGQQLAAAVVGPAPENVELTDRGLEHLKQAFSLNDVRLWWASQSDDVKGGLRGAGIGAGLGMAGGAMTSRRRPLRDALVGGLLGAGLGGAGGYALGATSMARNDKQRLADEAALRLQGADTQRSLLGEMTDFAKEVATGTDAMDRTLRFGMLGGVTGGAAAGGLTMATRAPGSSAREAFGKGVGRGFRWGGIGGGALGAVGKLRSGLGPQPAPTYTLQNALEDYNAISATLPPDLKQQAEDALAKFKQNLIDSRTYSNILQSLHGKKVSSSVKTADESLGDRLQGARSAVKDTGSDALKQLRGYEDANGIPGVLLGSGIGALAGGALGLTNRRNRFRGLLAGMLGGGLAGGGLGYLANQYGPNVVTPKPATSDKPPTVSLPPSSAGAAAPETNQQFVQRGGGAVGAVGGTIAGVVAGPRMGRWLADRPTRELQRLDSRLALLRSEIPGGLSDKAFSAELKHLRSLEPYKKLETAKAQALVNRSSPASQWLKSPWGSRFGRLGGGLAGGLLGGSLGSLGADLAYQQSQGK